MLIQEALCIHESPRELSLLLLCTLQFFSRSPKELAILREVCREFKRCVDDIIKKEVQTLLGSYIHPLPGQAIGEVYDVAVNHLDENSRKRLRDDCDLDYLRQCAFDIGLIGNYTRKKCEFDKISKSINIVCIVPIKFESKVDDDIKEPSSAMIAKVPLGIKFNWKPNYLNDKTKSITAIYMEPKFLHMNRDDQGNVYVARDVDNYYKERDLYDTLRRVQREILTFDAAYPNPKCAYSILLHSTGYGGSAEIYQEYKVECLKIYRTYMLGEKLPNLEPYILSVLNELRTNKIKKYYLDKMEAECNKAQEKIKDLEKKVNRKYRFEKTKQLVHLAGVIFICTFIVFERYDFWRKLSIITYMLWKLVFGPADE